MSFSALRGTTFTRVLAGLAFTSINSPGRNGFGTPFSQFKGSGTINGSGDYGFLLTGIDGALPGGQSTDKFRIKVTDNGSDGLVYDNKHGESDNGNAATDLGGGSIIIHDN